MAKSQKVNMKDLLENTKREVVDLTSLKFSTIVGVGIDEESGARKVTLELVERSAIPDSMDLLGIYDVIVDDSGSIQSFQRVAIRKRSDTVATEEF